MNLLLVLLLGIMMLTLRNDALSAEPPRYAIALHGGSLGEGLPPDVRAAMERSLRATLLEGQRILEQGGSSLDAVEHVVRRLEDDPLFNAGRGAVLNQAGNHELDASIMDGRDLSCGAVAGVRTVKNPISLARLVMTQTRHVLLIADGAEAFAKDVGAELAPRDYFRTPERIEEWRRRAEKEGSEGVSPKGSMGTVGCVALDSAGNLAAATSTGGVNFKMVGRIGDSPIVGAGTYADNRTCAVSCTGTGEEFIRRAAAYQVSALMEYRGVSLDEAVRIVVDEKLPQGSGAMIAVGRDGQISQRFNTPGLARAAADSTGRVEVKVGD